MIPEGWVCLKEVAMDYEADIIVGLLQDNNISAVKHYPEAGEYLKLAYGLVGSVRVYVAPEDYDSSKALLASREVSELIELITDAPNDGTDLTQVAAEGINETLNLKDKAEVRLWTRRKGILVIIALMLILAFALWAYRQGAVFFSR